MRYIATESELLPEIYECCISCTKIIIHTGEMPVFFVFINYIENRYCETIGENFCHK